MLNPRHRWEVWRGSAGPFSVVVAVVIHAVAFGVWPEYVPSVYQLQEEPVLEFVPLPDIPIPPPPPEEPPIPEIPSEVEGVDDLDDEITMPFTDPDLETVPPVPPPSVGGEEPFLAFDTQPVVLHLERPEYPEMARRADLEGLVKVRVKIDKTGQVVDAEVVASTAEVFDKAAIGAAYKCRFAPARQREIPVPCRIVIPFRFSLED